MLSQRTTAPREPRITRFNRVQLNYVTGSPTRTIIFGTIGSLLMMFGSFGVGWLAAASPLNTVGWIANIRYNVPGLVTSVVLVAVGGMMMTREWLRLSQKMPLWDAGSKKWTWAAIIAWSTPQLFAFPLFSRDMFSYFAQGRVMQSGLNPYEYGVSSVNNFFQYGADPMWAESPPPYGPVFLWIEQTVATIVGQNVDAGIYFFRFIAVLGCLLIAYYTPKLAQLHDINPTRTLWLVVANPLFIAQFITAGHNDALMTGLMVAGAYHAARWRNWKGGLTGTVLVTLAVAIKPLALVLLPFIGLLWAGRAASWPRKFSYWALVGTIFLALMAFMGWLNGLGFGWIGALSTTGGQHIWYAPSGGLGIFVGDLAHNLTGIDNATVRDGIGSIGKLIGMFLAVMIMFRGKDEDLLRRAGFALACVVAFSPMVQSWYLLWFIPFLAASGIRTGHQLDFYFLTTLFFMIYAIVDQLSVSPYLDTFDINMARLIAGVTTLAYSAYLLFVDPATRRVLRSKRRQSVFDLII
ncbi:polyprenol phosphomannose-dependent alpha 1,6 mannosyltransferase MptB [Rothia sp. ZJ932]|uniref:polyprenol phosphomannose-dependent alpha 1,6 mannosyltransferase MptB n=1 Tax=Rothia sp. ZJ932 TaxID=2810516 RepID=UPI0019688109|nr:polyprenol phosphomannose-dependent alpha 1,6 mannosyltransferase MptB [Rothia sp. ZJ932]QRZ62378.1 polyprenol phosphomannose-dependent alpha 1,6 mannosyltransferase MptB [Rothia sp. ZJ932]